MGRERRDTLELHKRYDKHDVFVLDGGHDHMARQWGWCRCGLFFHRAPRKDGDADMPWEPITCHKLLKKCAEKKWQPGIDRLHAEVLYCKRIGMKGNRQ